MSKVTKEQLDELIKAYAMGQPKISDEEWKIISYRDIRPNMYEVSNCGNIRKAKTKTVVPTHIWGAGYAHVRLNIKGSGKSRIFTVHRIVGWHFVSGYSKENCIINHIDGNKTNNNWYNLEWCTQKHNTQHAFDIGLQQKKYGESSIRHFVNEETVDRICKMLVEYNGHIKPILDILNSEGIYCTFGIIECIKSKETWVEISDKYFSKDYFKNKQIDEIEMICKSIVKHEGDIKSVLNELKNVVPYISNRFISDIKCGTRFPKISIKYFEPNQFKRQVYFNEKQVRMICESLVKYKGDSQKVYTELKDLIGENLTIDRIKDIKGKGSYMNISDEYFKKSELNKEVIDTDSLDFIRSLLILDAFKGSPISVYNALNHEKYPRITESIISMIKCGSHQSYLRSNKYDLNKYYDDMDKHNFIPVSKELIDRLIESYSSGLSDIDDSTYDDLVEQYVKENGEEYRPFNRQKQSDAVNDIVGTLPKLYGVDKPMRDGLPTLNEYIEKHPDYCVMDDKISNATFIIQPKFDGCSVALDCESERFFTRGSKDDGESLDVTTLFRDKIDDIKRSFDGYVDFDDVKAVKFEAIMSDRVYSECLANGDFPKQYKRARDAVSAIITPPFNNKELAKYITLIPLRYYTIDGQYEIHQHLKRMSRYANIFNKQFDTESVDQCIETLKSNIRNLRDTILKNGATMSYKNDNYACDGIVISVERVAYHDIALIGPDYDKIEDIKQYREIDPDNEVAIKIINCVKETKLIDIIYQLGNSGRITPVGILEPVKFDNITVDHVTLSTFERVSDMGLRVGDTVRIMYNIIPYFIGTNHDGGVPFALPDKCPICGAKINLTNLKYVTCDNPKCRGRIIGKICKYAESMRIFGFAEGKIAKMFELGYLNNVGDIYTFDADKLKNENGFGEASVNDIVNNINKASTNVPIERWLGAMTDGYSVMSWISILDQLYGREVSCVDDIVNMCHDETPNRFIEKIQSGMPYMNFSKFSIDNICMILKTRWKDIQDTIDHVNFVASTKSNGNKGVVCMSGTRDETVKRILEEAGYTVTDKFNNNIVMLVVPYLGFKSSKVVKANKKGIRIVDVEDIYDRRHI